MTRESETAVAIMLVDNIDVDEDSISRLSRIDMGIITHEEAVNEVKKFAQKLAQKVIV